MNYIFHNYLKKMYIEVKINIVILELLKGIYILPSKK